MKEIEFRAELSKEGFEIYMDSSLTFYQDSNGVYYYSESYGTEKMKAGETIDDVEEVLKAYA